MPSVSASAGWMFDHWLVNRQPTGVPFALATDTAVFTQAGTAPVIIDIPNAEATDGTPYWGPTPSLAQGAAAVTCSLVTGPSGMTIDVATGRVHWSNVVAAGSPHNGVAEGTNTTRQRRVLSEPSRQWRMLD